MSDLPVPDPALSGPFAPPATPLLPPPPGLEPEALRRDLRRAASLALVPFLSIAVAVCLLALRVRLPATLVMLLGGLVALGGVGLGLRTAVRALRLTPVPGGTLAGGLFTALAGVFGAAIGTLGAMASLASFSRGRQLRRRGRIVHAELEPGEAWCADAGAAEAAPDGVADAWRDNGRTEHASVAAFSRVSTELMALGAPASLIATMHRDALDEVRHAELCFGLARDLDGRALGPAAFPAVLAHGPSRGPRSVRLARLAVDALIDGALNEGTSARAVADLSRRTEAAGPRGVLTEIARDEARHAADNFAVVRWCVEQGGTVVQAALQAAAARIPDTLAPGPHPEAADGRWEAWGIPSRATECAAFEVERRRLMRRVEALVMRAAA
jgi:hypothetical protein